MFTISTMIYLIVFIGGITIVSLYLNIYNTVRISSIISNETVITKAHDAIEDLHLQNMELIEQVDKLKKESYKSNLKVRPSRQTRGYYEDRNVIENRLEDMMDDSKCLIRHHDKTKKNNVIEVQYKSNIKYKDEGFKITGTNDE